MSNSDNNPYRDMFSDPFGIFSKVVGGDDWKDGYLRAHAATDRSTQGDQCPRCHRYSKNCRASYCVYP